MHSLSVTASNEAETEAVAIRVAGLLRARDIVTLRGNLGAGKTVFARALIRALAGDDGLDVPSPTFTILQTYDTPRGAIWHFDLYRIKDPEEIYELGWEEALADGITLVEWPERLGDLNHDAKYQIEIGGNGDGPRQIDITMAEV